MNKQEAFDKIYEHAMTMTKPAIDNTGTCMYRSPNGPCLIGCLIKDEFYTPALDANAGSDAEAELVVESLIDSGVDEDVARSGFFLEVQKAHDDAVSDSDFRRSMLMTLVYISQEHNLDITNAQPV